jgi:hypothetical protein
MALRKSLTINGRKIDGRAVGGFSAGLLDLSGLKSSKRAKMHPDSDSCTARYSPSPGSRASIGDASAKPRITAARNLTRYLSEILMPDFRKSSPAPFSVRLAARSDALDQRHPAVGDSSSVV